MTITFENVLELKPHQFCAEASDLGWRDGFPFEARTTLGNKQRFQATHVEKREADNELLWIDYKQANGCITLRVFND